MYVISKNILVSIILLASIAPAFAYDLDEGVAIYLKALEQKRAQKQQAPQRSSRKDYQKMWLEQQGLLVQPVLHDVQAKQNTQVIPEADGLFLAAVNGDINQISKLLSQGLDINVSNTERETALHMAAARGHYSTVIYLINNGAYVNARTIKNWLPLHHAVRFNHPNITNYLLKRGSSAYEKTSDGLSAIDMARNVNNYRLLSILGAR